jgi:DNA-binding transcriptional ArsR family regulator
MLADADLSSVAELMSAHRASMLLALSGGRALTAGDLAARAGISASLASNHLHRLLEGGLVSVEQQGRRRLYTLASPHVAEVIEAMLTLAPERRATNLRDARQGDAIRRARTCYDHLAGALGVALTDALEHQGVIRAADDHYVLTDRGEHRLQSFGIDVEDLRGQRRAFARSCLDWTERRPHLAGALGAGIADRLLELGWVTHVPRGRALRVTDPGHKGLRAEFAINF